MSAHIDAESFERASRNSMSYKGYTGIVTYDDEAGIFHGEVANLRDVITFQGTCVEELRRAFRETVEDYLAICKERGEEPKKPFSGKISLRIPPDLHRRISIQAKQSDKSVNRWITETLERAVS